MNDCGLTVAPRIANDSLAADLAQDGIRTRSRREIVLPAGRDALSGHPHETSAFPAKAVYRRAEVSAHLPETLKCAQVSRPSHLLHTTQATQNSDDSSGGTLPREGERQFCRWTPGRSTDRNSAVCPESLAPPSRGVGEQREIRVRFGRLDHPALPCPWTREHSPGYKRRVLGTFRCPRMGGTAVSQTVELRDVSRPTGS